MKYVAVCKALYDYEPLSDDELSFKENDVLYILENDDQDWWKAQLKMTSADEGPIGLVPATYVTEADHVGNVKAIYDYEAQQEEELTFQEDDVMILYEDEDPDWFLAKTNKGNIGLIPGNYVQHVTNQASNEHNATSPLPPLPTQINIEQPSPQPINEPPRFLRTDEAKSWQVNEYDREKKKKKKSRGNLLVGNGMFCYGSETDKASPVRQFTITQVTHHVLEGKCIHVEMNEGTVFDFQATSKSEAKAIQAKIEESLSLSNAEQSSAVQTPAQSSVSPLPNLPTEEENHTNADSHLSPPAPEIHQNPQPSSPSGGEAETTCEPRWAIALYDFEPQDTDEIELHENDQILVFDYERSNEWWVIERQDGKSGVVPASYVKFHDEQDADTSAQELDVDEPGQYEESIESHDTNPDLEMTGAAGVSAAAVAAAQAIRKRQEENDAIERQRFAQEKEERDRQLRLDQEERDRQVRLQQEERDRKIRLEQEERERQQRLQQEQQERQRRKQQEEQRQKQQEEQERQRREQEERHRQEQEERRKREENRHKEEEQRRQKEEEAARERESRRVAMARSPAVGSESPSRRSQIPAPAPPTAPTTAKLTPERPAPTAVNTSGKPDMAKVRLWTDRTGAFKVEAQLLSCANNKIRLHKVNGVKIDVAVPKMCIVDLRYIEHELGTKLIHDTNETPSAKPSSVSSGPVNNHWNWLDYFNKVDFPQDSCRQYAATFQREGLREADIENLTYRQLKSFGMTENHVQRLQRFIETGVAEPASESEGQHKLKKKSVTFGHTSVIDDGAVEDEPVNLWSNRQRQIEDDERLARELQAQEERSQQSPSSLHRRGTGRPAPAQSAPKDVNAEMLEKIKSQLSHQPLKPAPAQPVAKPSSPAGSSGFTDDAWGPKQDAMEQTKAAWSAPLQPQQQQQPQGMASFSSVSQQGVPQPMQQQSVQRPMLQSTASQPAYQRPTAPLSAQSQVDSSLLAQWTGQNPRPQAPPQNIPNQTLTLQPSQPTGMAVSPSSQSILPQGQFAPSSMAIQGGAPNPAVNYQSPPQSFQPQPMFHTMQPMNVAPQATSMSPTPLEPMATGSAYRNWALATPDNPFGNQHQVQQVQQVQQMPVQMTGQHPGAVATPAQVFASMMPTNQQRPVMTGSGQPQSIQQPSAFPPVNPHDRYSVFKSLDTNTPSVFSSQSVPQHGLSHPANFMPPQGVPGPMNPPQTNYQGW